MSFIDALLSKEQEAANTMQTAATRTEIVIKDGKRQIVKHLQKNLSGLRSYESAFKNEYETGKRLKHENILAYEAYGKEDDGTSYIRMANISGSSLSFFLQEHQTFVTNAEEVSRLIDQLLSAVAYMHREQLCHFDIRPSNILISQSRANIYLVNPLYPYRFCRPAISFESNEFSAPELWIENGHPDERCDIYSIGKIIQYLYRLSDLPYKYKSVVKKATNPNPAKRYSSIEKMQKAIHRRTIWNNIRTKGAYIAIAALVIFGIIRLGQTSDEEPEVLVTPTTDPNFELPEGTMVNDAGFVVPDTSLTYTIELTEDEKALQKIFKEKAEEIFKKEFSKKANEVLSKLYTRENMNSNITRFKNLSQQSLTTLEEYQKELCLRYEMDMLTGAKLASQAIATISKQKMEELEKQAKEKED